MSSSFKVHFVRDDLLRVCPIQGSSPRTSAVRRKTNRDRIETGSHDECTAASEDAVSTGNATWKGGSGRLYNHSVYSLIECPPLPQATFVLVKRLENGHREVLHVGVAATEAPIYNLAGVRRRGARLGANEVHVHPHPKGLRSRTRIARDLRAGIAKPTN
jgi:hypothetical protein